MAVTRIAPRDFRPRHDPGHGNRTTGGQLEAGEGCKVLKNPHQAEGLAVGLTECASAAGHPAGPRTNLRSTARSGRAVAERKPAPYPARRLHARVRLLRAMITESDHSPHQGK